VVRRTERSISPFAVPIVGSRPNAAFEVSRHADGGRRDSETRSRHDQQCWRHCGGGPDATTNGRWRCVRSEPCLSSSRRLAAPGGDLERQAHDFVPREQTGLGRPGGMSCPRRAPFARGTRRGSAHEHCALVGDHHARDAALTRLRGYEPDHASAFAEASAHDGPRRRANRCAPHNGVRDRERFAPPRPTSSSGNRDARS